MVDAIQMAMPSGSPVESAKRRRRRAKRNPKNTKEQPNRIQNSSQSKGRSLMEIGVDLFSIFLHNVKAEARRLSPLPPAPCSAIWFSGSNDTLSAQALSLPESKDPRER